MHRFHKKVQQVHDVLHFHCTLLTKLTIKKHHRIHQNFQTITGET